MDTNAYVNKMNIIRKKEDIGGIRPKVADLLMTEDQDVLYFGDHGDIRHPLAEYNVSTTKIIDAFIDVFNCLEDLESEDEDMGSGEATSNLRSSYKELLYGLNSHYDVCYDN
mgnify:CR=1 FL=1